MGQHAKSFHPVTDIPSLEGKVIFITGGYSGLGKQTALDLAKHGPAEIWIAGRSAKKAEPTLSTLKSAAPTVVTQFLELDLASFASVREAAAVFLSSTTRLDILMLNAGVMDVPLGVTDEGYEVHFGINHMGHALLVKLLGPRLDESSRKLSNADVRVVVVSSDGHKHPPSGGIQFEKLKSPAASLSCISRYAQSKLANVLYARELARRFPQWTTVSLHPGTVKTELHQSGSSSLVLRIFQTLVLPLVGVTVEDGVRNHLWAATAADIQNGEYYEPVGVLGKASSLSYDMKLGQKLWN